MKALSLVGFGKARLTMVSADAQGRMRGRNCLRSMSVPWSASGGNVNTGAFDPAAVICARGHERAVVHLDEPWPVGCRCGPDALIWWPAQPEAGLPCHRLP